MSTSAPGSASCIPKRETKSSKSGSKWPAFEGRLPARCAGAAQYCGPWPSRGSTASSLIRPADRAARHSRDQWENGGMHWPDRRRMSAKRPTKGHAAAGRTYDGTAYDPPWGRGGGLPRVDGVAGGVAGEAFTGLHLLRALIRFVNKRRKSNCRFVDGPRVRADSHFHFTRVERNSRRTRSRGDYESVHWNWCQRTFPHPPAPMEPGRHTVPENTPSPGKTGISAPCTLTRCELVEETMLASQLELEAFGAGARHRPDFHHLVAAMVLAAMQLARQMTDRGHVPSSDDPVGFRDN